MNLVVKDSMEGNREMENTLKIMKGVITFIRSSPKQFEVFKDMVAIQEHTTDRHELRPMCPTKWVMRLSSVDSLLIHYSTVLDKLEMSENDGSLKADKRAEARVYVRCLEEFSTYFHIRVFQKLLYNTNPIHTMCQGREVL